MIKSLVRLGILGCLTTVAGSLSISAQEARAPESLIGLLKLLRAAVACPPPDLVLAQGPQKLFKYKETRRHKFTGDHLIFKLVTDATAFEITEGGGGENGTYPIRRETTLKYSEFSDVKVQKYTVQIDCIDGLKCIHFVEIYNPHAPSKCRIKGNDECSMYEMYSKKVKVLKSIKFEVCDQQSASSVQQALMEIVKQSKQ